MADYTVQDLQDNLDYLNNTKQIIKQSIINKGQAISDTDTFRSYADKISAIETGKGDVKLFETEEAMQADTKAKEGDLAVVYKNEINVDTFKGLYEYDSNYKDTNSIQLVNISNTEITEYSENFSFNWNNSFGTVIDLSKLKKCLDKMNEDLSKSNFYIFVKDNEIYASPYDETSNNISNVYILNTGEIIGLGPNLAAYKDLSTLPSVQMYKLNLDTSTYTLYQTINVSQTTYKRDKTYYFYYYPFIPDTFCLYGYNNLTNELNYCLIFPNNDGTYKLIPSNINVNMDKSYLVSSKYILAPTQLTLAASNELLSGKIAYGKNGVVTGTLEPGLDTSDATATANDIIAPKTAYVNGGKITGTMPNNGTLNYTPNTAQQTIPAGYTSGGTLAGDSNLIPENIKKDVSIFNVIGTMSGDTATYNYETTDYTISHIDSTDAVTYMDVLQDYALIEFTGPRVDLYHKVDNTWTLLKNITTKSIAAADGSQDSISKGTSRIIKVENNIVYIYTGVIDTNAKIIGYIFTYNINTQELDKHVIENTTSDSVGTMDIMTYNSNYMITGLSEKTVTWYSIDFDNYTITEINEAYSGRGNTAIKNNVWLSTLYYRTGYIFNTASGTAQKFGDINMDGSIAAILFDETKVIKNDGNVYEINVEWQIGNKVGESNYLDVFTNNEKLYCINSKYYRYEDSLYELTVTDTTYTFTLVTTNTNIDRCNNTIYLTTPVGDTAINNFYEFIPGTTIVSMNYDGDVWYNHPVYNGAISSEILEGNYSYDANHSVVQGTMPNNGDLEITPSSSVQNFDNGYYNSIKVQATITTDDATAVAEDIADGKTAYVKGEKITGTVFTTPYGANIAWQTHEVTRRDDASALDLTTYISVNAPKQPRLFRGNNKLILSAHYEKVAEVIGLTADKIAEGNTILGIEGTASAGLDTSDANATAEDIAEDKTAYVKGQKITGSVMTTAKGASPAWQTHDIVSNSGNGALYASTIISNGDKPRLYQGSNKLSLTLSWEDVSNVIGLTSDKIVAGNTIIGVKGTATSLDTSDADAIAEDILINKTAYVNGQKITGTLPLFPNTRTFTVSNAGVTNNIEDSTLDLTTINTTKQILDSNVSMNFNADYSDVATAIGLTPEKIIEGNTIIGVEGTATTGDDVSNYISSEKGVGITNGRLTDYIVQIPLIDTSEAVSMNNMFQYFNMLKTIPLIDTSKVTSMGSMFAYCSSLQTVPLLNTSEVTSMTNMFQYCYSLQTIPLLDTSKVTSMGNMFHHCEALTSIPQIDTSKVTSMSSMFAYCSSLQTVPVLDLSSATSMYKVFNYCEALSNDSLNNILASLLTATSYKGTKTLNYMGLTETQATTCTTLSNWAACEEAGWTTGY